MPLSLIDFYTNEPAIFCWLIIKLVIITINLIINISTFGFLELISASLLLGTNSGIYKGFYILTEAVIGIYGLINYDGMFFSNLLIFTCLFPLVSIWVILVFYSLTFNSYNSYTAKMSRINSKILINSIEITESIECPICLIKCFDKGHYCCENKHIFHQECLSKWISTESGNKKCPICRQ